MSALGQKQTFALQNGMSALPPKADMCGAFTLAFGSSPPTTCVLNQNYQRPRLPVVELMGSFCHSTAGRGWTVLLTHQTPFLSQRGAIYLSSLGPRYGGFRIADYFFCVIRLTLAWHQHGIGFALINGKRGTGVSRYAPQTRI